MSTNLSPEQKLTMLALAAPDRCPYSAADDCRPYCLFRRAQVASDVALHEHLGLLDFASELGFDWLEAMGVMRGWDRADGKHPCFDDEAADHTARVARGEAIGARLHARLLGN